MRAILFLISALLIGGQLLSCRSSKEEKASPPPNIVVFFTDDQGYGDLGCYGARDFETPYIDQLAAEGIRFTNFYVPATVCTPSRAGLLTGRYPVRYQMHEAVLFPFSEGGLPLQEYTLAELLRDAGYSTSCIGKWHLGHKPEFMPNNQGFEEFYGVPYSNDMDAYYYEQIDFQSPPLPFYRNEEQIESGPDQDYLTKRYTEEAVRQIKERDREQPFFMYIAQNMPHVPLHASPDFRGKSKLGLYGDVIMELDWSVGQITSALREEGIYENTIFIYTSDNGPDLGSSGPLRGKKAETWDGGQRVPAIISWPKVFPKQEVCDQMVSTMDLFPTIARWAGATMPESLVLDGLDAHDVLMGASPQNWDNRPFYYYARNGELEAVRYGQWKLHLKKSIGWKEEESGEFEIALYDLGLDIGERTNVASEHPNLVSELTALVQGHMKELQKGNN